MDKAAEAPIMAAISGRLSWSTLITVQLTTTSLRISEGNRGRIGRSMSREARMARSEGRPSRRIKLPGMRPTAYRRSSKSTERGKKSMPSRGFFEAVTLTNTQVSPQRTITAALERPPNLPVSSVSLRPARVVSYIFSFGNSILVIMIKGSSFVRHRIPQILALEPPFPSRRAGRRAVQLLKMGKAPARCYLVRPARENAQKGGQKMSPLAAILFAQT